MLNKVTVGFVIQKFDTETNKFISQEFIASDEVTWEDPDEIDEPTDAPVVNGETPYLNYTMVQPPVSFSIGDHVMATPIANDIFTEFQGTIKNIRSGNFSEILYTVEDQDGDGWDCFVSQLKHI